VILEMDVGNSRAKWRLLNEQGDVEDRGDYPSLEAFALSVPGVRRVRIASVAGSEARARLAAEVLSVLAITAEFAATSAFAAGVKNSYPDPSRMGVDRWLALLAARARMSAPVIVVDAGTAITVDVLDAAGTHAGGYIMPGLALLDRVLQSGTREVLCGPLYDDPLVTPGIGTDQSVGRGVRLMAVAAIERAVSECQMLVGGAAAVLLCGGDVAIMRSQMPVAWCHEPDLVLDGLALALP
jgi:type III pantothenate kinase